MLTDVPSIDQRQLKTILKATIKSNTNLLVFGPSGSGKTYIANEAAAEEGCKLVYINLAVLERTDFQGFPVLSDDKRLVSYATPEFLPFADTLTKDEASALTGLVAALGDKDKIVAEWAQERLAELDRVNKAQLVERASFWVNNSNNDKVIKNYAKLLDNAKKVIGEHEPVVVLFDEADKAIAETMQTMLELLQFRSINARKLNIKANFLTGNLPDEHAHTSQISHAISKRGNTYRLIIDFNQWREWAFKNGVHSHIVQYLSTDPGMIHKSVTDGDTTQYALPSPRTWTSAAQHLTFLDNDEEFKRMSMDKQIDLRRLLVAGSVGDTAAIKFSNWYKFYRQYDPMVMELCENGKMPNPKEIDSQALLIVSISACSKAYSELKPDNTKKIEKYTKNVYSWINTLSDDIKIAAVRLAFASDWDSCHKYNLAQIKEFRDVFKSIEEKLQMHGANLSTKTGS